MYVIRGSYQQDQAVRHYRFTIHLEQSLVELFKLYEHLGGVAPHAPAALDQRIERCLGDHKQPRAVVQNRLHALRRAKDLHAFLTGEPDLQSVKQRMMEHVLFHRGAEARWAAIRELLLEHMDLICESPLAGLAVNAERYKDQLSRRTSRLGRLLVATALFNFDECQEEPPPNLSIRFRARHFPEHAWSVQANGTRDGQDWSCANWAPENALCRWEYLAADLASTLFARSRLPAADAAGPRQGRAANRVPPPALVGAVRMRVGLRFAEEGDPRQLDLLTVTPESLTTELQRGIHRRHGSDGLRVFATVMAALDESAPVELMTLDLDALATQAFGASRGARVRQARLNKVRAVLERMADLEVTRHAMPDAQDNSAAPSTSRFLTVLERAHAAPDGTGGRWRVLADAVFHACPHGTLGVAYRDLPPALLAGEDGARHPYRLALYVFLRRAWAAEGLAIERSARELFQDAGLWFKEASPYRSLELLKRELNQLKDAGWLGRWRIVSPGRRAPLEDSYRLEAPGSAARAAVPDGQPVARLASSDEAGGRALQEGWT